MRLACDGCDKVYVVDEELLGRAFRMRCKRCGHVISVAPTPAAADDFLDFSRELQDFCEELERKPGSRSAAPAAMQARPPALPARPGSAAVAMPPPVQVHPTPPPVPARPPRLRSVPPPPDPAADAPAQPEALPAPGRSRAAPAAWIGAVALLAAGFMAYVWFGSVGRGGTPPAPAGRPQIALAPVAVAPSSPAPPERPPEEAGPAPVALPVPAPDAAALSARSGERAGPSPVSAASGPRRKVDTKERARSSPPVVAAAANPPAAAPPPEAVPAPAALAPPAIRAGPAPAPPPDLPPRDEQQLQAALAGYAASFDACVAQAWRDEPDLLANPRPVVVTMTVRPSGRTAYPTLDDAQLSGTALGACLKRQSAALVFPEAGGEPVRARLSLVLGR